MTRSAWGTTCQRAAAEKPATSAQIRSFFEREFEAFQVQSTDRSQTGVLTGYFEPLLEGSVIRTSRFRYPVYGVPTDLLLLDARLVRPGQKMVVRIEGREVVPVSAAEAQGSPLQLYLLDVGSAAPDLRDRRIRVRRDGDRIVRYLTRQAIDASGLPSAPVIAWVDDQDLLYLMHVQGSGRIRVGPDRTIRVAFGEQNGHPFRPKVTVATAAPVRTRGGAIGNAGATVEQDPQVQSLIDYFLAQAAAGASKSSTSVQRPSPSAQEPAAKAPSMPREAGRSAELATPPGASQSDGPQPSAQGGNSIRVSSEDDPSYVFFRQIPDTGGGPPGALGVPLTPEQSLAVDPRVTPLGAPVFISAKRRGSAEGTTRLMIAQDTGGAIRGAVRADYFWGFGRSAGAAAMRMKDELRMWILLPKGLDLASRHGQLIRTRGGSSSGGVDCLIEDPELCVE